MNLLPNLKDKEDVQLTFPMGNWSPEANLPLPKYIIYVYRYNLLL